MSRNVRLRELTDALIEGRAIDWDSARSATDDGTARRLIEQLRGIARIAEAHRELPLIGDDVAAARLPACGEIDEIPSGFDGYRFVEPLAESGLTITYRAISPEPEGALVVIKLVKWEIDSPSLDSRFDETKARLDRAGPAIARWIRCGTSPEGRFYLVMEYVEGLPVNLFAGRSRLGGLERLRLWDEVCAGVEEGHGVGVLHRGLRPSTIFVVGGDAGPSVRIHDFGVASLLAEREAEWLLLARYGLRIPSLGYIPPEETRASPHVVDERADVFALGSLLFELLSGETLLKEEPLRVPGVREARRLVREPVSRPLGSTSVADHALSAALDRVILRARRQDPAARFESVRELRSSISEWLA